MKTLIKKILKLRRELKKGGCNITIVAIRFLYYYIFYEKKIILAHQRAIIKNVRNIKMTKGSVLFVGTAYRGFMTKKDYTLLNVVGTLIVNGHVNIAPGARIDVLDRGVLELNNLVTINSNTLIVCTKKIVFGEGTGVSWNCQFMDSDLHEINYCGSYPSSAESSERDGEIIIGKNVLILCRTSVYKNVQIADNCVIASDCVIKNSFMTPETMICMKTVAFALPGKVSWKH